MPDRQLVENLKAGSTEAFDALFFRYHVKVYRFALGFHISPDEAEEAVQEIFCAVWQNRMEIDPARKFSSYLYGIARNQVYTIIRKKALFYDYLRILGKDTGAGENQTEIQVDARELKEMLERHIAVLPPRRREIFCMSRFENLSYREIAERLHISEDTVDTQIRQALNYLRTIFEKQ